MALQATIKTRSVIGKNKSLRLTNLTPGYVVQDSPTVVDDIKLTALQVSQIVMACSDVFKAVYDKGFSDGDVKDYHFVNIYPIDVMDSEQIEQNLAKTFHLKCKEFGVAYSDAGTESYIVSNGGGVFDVIAKEDAEVSVKLHLSMLRAAMSSVENGPVGVADLQALIQAFPHKDRGVLIFYDGMGVKRPGAPYHLPQDSFSAVCGLRVETSDLLTRLTWLHYCVLMRKETGLVSTVQSAISTLSAARYLRMTLRDNGKRTKKFMTARIGLDNTIYKFQVTKTYDFIVHPGSGPRDRLSRHAFEGSKVICIDPIGDGDDFVMTFEQFLDSGYELPHGSGCVVSDIADYYPSGGLKPEGTNQGAALAIKYAVENGLDFVVKVCLDVDEKLPPVFFEKIFRLKCKLRLHNLEFIVENGNESIVDIFHWGAPVVKFANDYREEMVDFNIEPSIMFEYLDPLVGGELKFKPCILDYEPARDMQSDFFYPDVWNFKKNIKFRGAKICDFNVGFFDYHLYKDIEFRGLSAADYAATLLERCKWLSPHDAITITAQLATEFGYPPEALLDDIVFQ